jgi:bifunctional non-homologous end joining protein LigD
VIPGAGMPSLIPPMLAAAGTPPPGPDWAYEFKYDGVRSVSYIRDSRVRLLSRNGNDVSASYPELAELGALLTGRRVVLDGEIVALEPGDRPSFARLQQRIHLTSPAPSLVAQVPVVYFVFDLLYLDGHDLIGEPYSVRRDVLTGLGLHGDHVRVPSNFLNVDGPTMLKAAELGGLEGVVAKKQTAPYRPGKRSSEWTKIPLIRTQEIVIVGWKAGEGRRKGLVGSLLLAVYQHDQLTFAGHVGTGFTDQMLRSLETQLAPLTRATPPLAGVPREYARYAKWVEPVLVGEVAFRNWTPENRLRHPSWRGLRPDRHPSSAKRESAQPALPPEPQVTGSMMTHDGRVRVEVVRQGETQSFRVLHDDSVLIGLDIEGVEALMAQLGISMDTLKPVDPANVARPSGVAGRLPA